MIGMLHADLAQRVVEPRSHILTPDEQTLLPAQVLALLAQRVGKMQAVTAQVIATELGKRGKYDDRKIRLAIAELVEQGHPIAASVSGVVGFYWIANAEEAREYLDDLRLRVMGIWKRYHDFARAAESLFGIKQLPLFVPQGSPLGTDGAASKQLAEATPRGGHESLVVTRSTE